MVGVKLNLRVVRGDAATRKAIGKLLRETAGALSGKEEQVARTIIERVRAHGDQAVVAIEQELTGTQLKSANLRVTAREFESAGKVVGPNFLAAIRRIARNLRAFHIPQRRKSWMMERDGTRLGQKFTAIDTAGIYVPAGRAPLPSTLMMTAIPAQVAGVGRIVVCTPPDREGHASPWILAAASTLGLKEVYKAGGAGAIAAMAFGTRTIPKVDKIVGPGNAYVVAAKKLLFGAVGIESLPGPSEVAIIADDSANPQWIAADLLAQAEHGPDSVCVLLTNSENLARAVVSSLGTRHSSLSRGELALQSLNSFGLIAVVDSIEECCALANELAPEHLQLMTRSPRKLLAKIKHAGAIFLGHYSPVPLGDYVAGPSHVLPTAGTARFSSGLGVDDFLKRSSVIEYTQSAARDALRDLEAIARAEGLDGHAEAVRERG